MDPNLVAPHILDEEAPGGMVINPHSALGKELRKWEQHRSELVPRGTNPGNPYVFREFPKMLYKAQRMPNGQYACLSSAPDPYAYERMDLYQQATLMVETFNRSCTRIVANESEERLAKGQGWSNTTTDALKAHEAHEQAIGDAAAEANFYAKRMTAKAQEELNAAAESTHQHVADVVGVAKSKRGRPKKAQAVVAVEEE